jgi:hypothetical protein
MEWFIATLMIVGLWLILRPKARRNSQSINRKQSAKYSKLLSMVGGDREAADRLISSYGIDKAIYDLERDRRIN